MNYIGLIIVVIIVVIGLIWLLYDKGGKLLGGNGNCIEAALIDTMPKISTLNDVHINTQNDFKQSNNVITYVPLPNGEIPPKNHGSWYGRTINLDEARFLKQVDTRNLKELDHTFESCEIHDISFIYRWDLSNLKHMFWTFQNARLKDIKFLDKIYAPNLESMVGMFSGVKDINNNNTWTDNLRWLSEVFTVNFPKLTSIRMMFWGCNSLTEVELDIDHQHLDKMDYLFSLCRNLRVVNLTYHVNNKRRGVPTDLDIDVEDDKEFINMCYLCLACPELTELNIHIYNLDECNICVDVMRIATDCPKLVDIRIIGHNRYDERPIGYDGLTAGEVQRDMTYDNSSWGIPIFEHPETGGKIITNLLPHTTLVWLGYVLNTKHSDRHLLDIDQVLGYIVQAEVGAYYEMFVPMYTFIYFMTSFSYNFSENFLIPNSRSVT